MMGIMDLRQLQYFVAVAEERHFTRGAQRAHAVQSTVSAAVARLEREFGVTLFERGRNGAQLTAAGQVLLRRAHVLLGEAERTRDELQRTASGLHGSVTLGTVLSTGDFDLVAALLTFRQTHPDVSVRLRLSAGPLDQHIEEVLDGHVQLLLLPVPSRSRPGIRIDRVTTMRLALACSATDPVAERRSVAYRDIADSPFIDFPEPWGNRTIVDHMFAGEHVERRVTIEVVDVATALRMVQGGLGLAFVPEEFIASAPGVVKVDLQHPPPSVELGLAVAQDRPRSEATDALRRTLLGARAAPAPSGGSPPPGSLQPQPGEPDEPGG